MQYITYILHIETITDIWFGAFAAGMKEINQTDLGPLNPAATGSFDAPPNPDQFEKRKKYFVPAMSHEIIDTCTSMIQL